MSRQDTRRGFNGARSALLFICDAVESCYQGLQCSFRLWLLEIAVEVGGLRGAMRAVRSAGAVGVFARPVCLSFVEWNGVISYRVAILTLASRSQSIRTRADLSLLG